MRTATISIISGGDMSQASITSNTIDLDSIFGFAIQAVYTGTAVGTLDVQGSCDDVASPSLVTNWTPVTSSASINAPGNTMVNLTNANYRWLRIVYTKTSGTGTLNVNMQEKGI